MAIQLSFVIPCYNEEGNVEAIFQAIHQTFDREGISVELVMVNDGSKDGTEEALLKLYLSNTDTNLKIVNFSRNFGKEAAILAGMKRTEGEYVCFIDADLQQSPEVALELYRRVSSDPKLDCAAAYQKDRAESRLLTFFKDSFYRTINLFSDTHFTKGASDFRVCSRRMVDAILSLPEVSRFSKGLFSWVGFETEFIPYEVAERNSGTTKWSFMKLFRYAVSGITDYSTAPLVFSFIFGLIVLAGSVIDLLVLLVRAILGMYIGEYSVAFALLFAVSGVLFIMIGIVGEYLKKIYQESKNRPIFIEKDVWERKENG